MKNPKSTEEQCGHSTDYVICRNCGSKNISHKEEPGAILPPNDCHPTPTPLKTDTFNVWTCNDCGEKVGKQKYNKKYY